MHNNIHSHFLRIVVSALLIIAFAGCDSDRNKEVVLSLKFQKGDIFKYKLNQDIKTKSNIMGTEHSTPVKMEAEFTQQVDDIKDGLVEISTKYESFNAKTNMGGQEISTSIGRNIVGKTINIKMTEKGEVKDIEGIENIPVLAQISTDFRRLFSSMYPAFPEDKVRVGSSWLQKQEIPLETSQVDINMNLDTVYTMKGFKKKKGFDCAVINADINLKMKYRPKQGGMNIKGDGKGRGSIYFAYKEGIVVGSEMNTTMNMMVEGNGKGGEQKITSTTESKIKMELLEKGKSS